MNSLLLREHLIDHMLAIPVVYLAGRGLKFDTKFITFTASAQVGECGRNISVEVGSRGISVAIGTSEYTESRPYAPKVYGAGELNSLAQQIRRCLAEFNVVHSPGLIRKVTEDFVGVGDHVH